MPPRLPAAGLMLAGVMCAAPESEGFTVSFHDLPITLVDPAAPALLP